MSYRYGRRAGAWFGKAWRGRRMAVVVTAVLLSLAGSPGARPAAASSPASVDGVPCSQVRALGLDEEMNLHASEILAGCELLGKAPVAAATGSGSQQTGPPEAAPTNVWVSNRDRTWPHVTASESMVWSSDGKTIVVNFNDTADAPDNLSGTSYSDNGGQSFTQIVPAPFREGHGRNIGDPVVVYNARLTTWFAGDLVQGCGPQGIGLWTSQNGISWTVGACAHVGSGDDRESMWVDNNPTSPFYGRMYVSFNDFSSVGARRPFATYSDDGVNWSTPDPLSRTFERNVQVTGAPDSGAVFIVTMDEGGGGFNPRTNWMSRSVDGGVTWTGIQMGAPFPAAGDSLCPDLFERNFPRISPIWRQRGYGQPAVGPGGVVHYVYAGRGVNPGDPGDIYYTRSLDNGDTWSEPIVLNTDQAEGGTAAQWMPSLSVTASGKVQAAWYDRRNSTDGQNYEYFGRQSLDNGGTWQPDKAISNQVIPQPEQPDPTILPCYAGDYNYHTAFGDDSYATWTDGRLQTKDPAGNEHNVQNVFFAVKA